MKYTFFPAFLSVFLFTSGCKKNNDAIVEGDFTPFSIAVSDIRMFATSGEIKDMALILGHINRRQIQAFFTYQKEEDPKKHIRALQLHNGKAMMVNANNSLTPEMPYSRTGGKEYRINFTSPTPITLPAYAIENKCGKIDAAIYLYPMQKMELTAIPSPSGVSWSFKPAYEYVFNNEGGLLKVPLIAYAFSSSNPLQGCGTAVGDNWNYLDEKVTALLDTGDTLVVQSKSMYLVRQ